MEQDAKLKSVENVIITPHVGSRTFRSVVKQSNMALRNLFDLLDNK
jgi:lactate dehydrogenase-like 2-hydroxyacid dehydrogenase